MMTSSDCRNGTERCAEAVGLLDETPEVVVNLQGDAPLTPPHYVEELLSAWGADASILPPTPAPPTPAAHLETGRAARRAERVGATTAVFDRTG
ncbi:MAG: 3-deoxy-manno-octulosonate cytidylyltransferase, partial [Verrucomicrobiota bacterium]